MERNKVSQPDSSSGCRSWYRAPWNQL